MSIRRKIQLTMIIVAVVCSLAYGSLVILTMHSFANASNDSLLKNANELSHSLLEQHREEATRSSTLVAENEQVIDSLAEHLSGGSRDALLAVCASLMDATGVDFLNIMDASGNVLLRTHDPDNYGDSVTSQENIRSAMQGKQYTTVEEGTAILLSVRCGTPIYDHNGALIGLVSLGYRLDQSGFVDYVKQMTGAETTIFLGNMRISTTVLTETGERAVGTTATEAVSAQVLAGNDYSGRANVVGKNLLTHYSPIRDAEGKVLGMLFVGLDTSATDSHIQRNMIIFAVDTVALLVAAWFGALYVSHRIASPLRKMSLAAKRLAEGDVDVEIKTSPNRNTKDETKQLAQAFSDMVAVNRERAHLISVVAQGDLRESITPKSEHDLVGVALEELLDKNNLAFSDMNRAATQLDIASSQVANGAEVLAHSASEQAEIVERLRLTLTALSHKTMEKVDSAKQAASLSESVREFAEKGSYQMDHMMDAMEQISNASASIENVIKTIDDIAFQTNILALNAAVEAAHAGQHGRGFAVVAEEVRSLAAKSAEAAKDTGSLIANSIEKAKLGAQISSDTAASFADIVGGVKESSVIIREIAEFIQVQNNDIQGITKGVDEIGAVIQSLSASAEESSASSEEMSSQATTMAHTLSGYKLRKGSQPTADMPLAASPR